MNRPQHLSDDELIGLLYGLGDKRTREPPGRLLRMRRTLERDAPGARDGSRRGGQPRKSAGAGWPPSGCRFWSVWSNLAGSHAWRWVPVAAAASLLAAGLFMKQSSRVPHPAPPAAAAVNSEADAELFTDVYSMEQDVEPRAAAPIRALFQETSLEEGPQ